MRFQSEYLCEIYNACNINLGVFNQRVNCELPLFNKDLYECSLYLVDL